MAKQKSQCEFAEGFGQFGEWDVFVQKFFYARLLLLFGDGEREDGMRDDDDGKFDAVGRDGVVDAREFVRFGLFDWRGGGIGVEIIGVVCGYRG